MNMDDSKEHKQLSDYFQEVVSEIQTLENSFEDVLLLARKLIDYPSSSNIFILGVGKSGLLASKFSSSLRSLGVKSFYVDTLDAAHGDLGAISEKDWVILVSDSGNTPELLPIARRGQELGAKVSSVLGKKKGGLERESNEVICIQTNQISPDQVPIPTMSNIRFTVFFELVCSAVASLKGISQVDFAKNHPGGNIGYLHNKTVAEVMVPIDYVGRVDERVDLSFCAKTLTAFPTGVILVETSGPSEPKRIGIITDGDVRRFLLENNMQSKTRARDLATWQPVKLQATDTLAVALATLKQHDPRPVSAAPVADNGRFVGVLTLQQITDWIDR